MSLPRLDECVIFLRLAGSLAWRRGPSAQASPCRTGRSQYPRRRELRGCAEGTGVTAGWENPPPAVVDGWVGHMAAITALDTLIF